MPIIRNASLTWKCDRCRAEMEEPVLWSCDPNEQPLPRHCGRSWAKMTVEINSHPQPPPWIVFLCPRCADVVRALVKAGPDD